MKILISYISIGSLVFDFVNDVQIESGWELLTDTAVIKLPSKLKIDKDALKDVIKKGDAVEVKLGYDDNLISIFKGYVAEVMPSTPIEIMCEDQMWKLKQINVNVSFKSGDVKSFLESIFPGTEVDAFEIKTAPITFNNINGAKVLEQFKSDYRLYSFFRDGKLIVGKQYDPNYAVKQIFKLDYNMESDDLVFKAKEDVLIAVNAISNLPNGEKIEIKLGDEGGDTTTLNFYNLPKSELQKVAEKEIERLRYDGFRGSFTAFGEPIVRHGDIVKLIHNEQSDKTGEYWVDSVSSSFGVGGFRQTIKLGART